MSGVAPDLTRLPPTLSFRWLSGLRKLRPSRVRSGTDVARFAPRNSLAKPRRFPGHVWHRHPLQHYLRSSSAAHYGLRILPRLARSGLLGGGSRKKPAGNAILVWVGRRGTPRGRRSVVDGVPILLLIKGRCAEHLTYPQGARSAFVYNSESSSVCLRAHILEVSLGLWGQPLLACRLGIIHVPNVGGRGSRPSSPCTSGWP